MTTDAHQKELTAQTTEQESLPTATTHKHFAVQTCNEETRKRVPRVSSEFTLVLLKKESILICL